MTKLQRAKGRWARLRMVLRPLWLKAGCTIDEVEEIRLYAKSLIGKEIHLPDGKGGQLVRLAMLDPRMYRRYPDDRDVRYKIRMCDVGAVNAAGELTLHCMIPYQVPYAVIDKEVHDGFTESLWMVAGDRYQAHLLAQELEGT